jgi:hypothetical protein
MRPVLVLLPVLGAGVLLGLSACIATPAAGPPHSSQSVPSPVSAPPSAAAPSARPSESSGPECDPAKLKLVSVNRDGAGGTLLHFVKVTNTGPACVLTQPPGLESAQGKPIATELGTMFPAPADRMAARVRPGEAAVIVFETSGSCLDGRPQTDYPRVRLVFAGGHRMALAEEVNSTCGVHLGQWYLATE